MSGTPAMFDYRELPEHFTGDRRCSCGELLECPAAQPAPDLLAAARAAHEALFDVYLYSGPTYGEGVTVRGDKTVRERINAANLAFAALKEDA